MSVFGASSRTVAIFLLLVSFVGCSSSLRYPKMISFMQCKESKDMDPASRSTAALLNALEDTKWMLLYSDLEEHLLRAKKCHPREASNCATLEFRMKPNGHVVGKNSPGTLVRGNLMDDLSVWENDLKQAFAKYRCAPADKLNEALLRYGLSD